MPKTRESISVAMRFHIMRRDKYTCQYCGAKAPDTALHVEHIVPVAKGGTNDPKNLCAACIRCNSGKGISSATTEDERPHTERERRLSREVDGLKRQFDRFEWASFMRLGDPGMKAVLFALCADADDSAEFSDLVGNIAYVTELSRPEVLSFLHGLEAVGVITPSDSLDEKPSIVWPEGDDLTAAGMLHVDWSFLHGGRLKPPYALSDYVAPLQFSSVERIHG